MCADNEGSRVGCSLCDGARDGFRKAAEKYPEAMKSLADDPDMVTAHAARGLSGDGGDYDAWFALVDRIEREKPPYTSVTRLPDGSTRVTFGPMPASAERGSAPSPQTPSPFTDTKEK